MKQNLLTITIDRAYLKKFQKKLNFFKFFSNKFKFFIKSAYLLAIPAMMLSLNSVAYAEAGEKASDLQIGAAADCSRLEFVSSDTDPLIDRCKDLALGGNPEASLHLANLYHYGSGNVYTDADAVFKWLELAEQNGSTKASLELGMIYYLGDLVKKDLARAQQYFEKAGKKDKDAFMLSIELKMNEAYELSFGIGTAVHDERLALEKYNDIAQIDSEYRESARLALGNMYLNGRGTMVDYTKAFYWFNLALPKISSINAENQNVALLKATMYRKGMGVKQDYRKARDIYELLIEKYRNAGALFELASMYSYGVGVKQDLEHAVKLFEEVQNIACTEHKVISGYPNLCAVVGYEIANINALKSRLEQVK